jgi:Co/Zn/Cd efflux system component
VLVGTVLAGFALSFPVPAVRRFYAPQLPHGEITTMLLVAAAGVAVLVCFWVVYHRDRREPPPAVRDRPRD